MQEHANTMEFSCATDIMFSAKVCIKGNWNEHETHWQMTQSLESTINTLWPQSLSLVVLPVADMVLSLALDTDFPTLVKMGNAFQKKKRSCFSQISSFLWLTPLCSLPQPSSPIALPFFQWVIISWWVTFYKQVCLHFTRALVCWRLKAHP